MILKEWMIDACEKISGGAFLIKSSVLCSFCYWAKLVDATFHGLAEELGHGEVAGPVSLTISHHWLFSGMSIRRRRHCHIDWSFKWFKCGWNADWLFG